MKWKNMAKCASVTAVILLMLFAVVGCGVSNEEHQVALDSVEVLSSDLSKEVDLNNVLSVELLDVKAIAESLSEELEVYKSVQVEVETAAAEEAKGYELDDLSIGAVPEKCLSDKQVDKLVDGEVEWDGDEYEVEEFLCLEALSLSVNGDDYGADVMLTAEERGMRYSVVVDSDLDVSDIDEDESLKLRLLGEEVEITNWDEDEVTLLKGTEEELEVGQGIFVNEKNVELYVAGDGFVYVIVDKEREKILEGEMEKVNGLEIEVIEVLPSVEWRLGMATLRIGEEVKVVIEDGEEYAEDSMWEWYVDGNELGLVLSEELTELDEDEDYRAVRAGESICLPEEYLCVVYSGMEEVDSVELSLDLDERRGEDYLRVKGAFTYDMDDYDRLYINSESIYDRDLEELGDCVEVDDTDYQLCLVEVGDESVEWVIELYNSEVAADLFMALDLSDIVIGGVGSISDEDEDWRSFYGVVFSNPEDAVDDSKLTVTIPEEMVTGTLLIK